MSSVKVRPLRDDLPFGSVIAGATVENLKDEAVRQQLKEVFETRGLMVFEDIEPSQTMQLSLSGVFGPLRDNPSLAINLVDGKNLPGVIEIKHDPEKSTIVEVDGKRLTAHLPWHFDQCYNDTLNRGGILRGVLIPPEGGLTGWADGIQLYEAISPDLRREIEGCKIMYRNDLIQDHMRFGRPRNFRELRVQKSFHEHYEKVMALPRAIHPAVWTRASGEKVLHLCPWFAVGIEGREDKAGDDLLEAVCQEVLSKMRAYYHSWKPTDMVMWDNWRMLHRSTGIDPQLGQARIMHRTTIQGDYGLGYFEGGRKGDAILERDV